MKRLDLFTSASLIFIFSISACTLPKSENNPINNGSLTDNDTNNSNSTIAVPTATLVNSPISTATIYGSASGQICYPESPSPELIVYLENINTHVIYEVEINADQTSFQAEIPPGGYFAFAWLTDYSQGGSYSQAVICGMGAACTDHTLATFFVSSGNEAADIDICDWPDNIEAVPTPSNKG